MARETIRGLALAKHPCRHAEEVEYAGRTYVLHCFEIWRVVNVDKDGIVRGRITCYQGHRVKGKAAELVSYKRTEGRWQRINPRSWADHNELRRLQA